MNQPDRSARPGQVTVAGWAVAIASVMLVLAVFDTMGHLESVDMRERLSEVISNGSAKGMGLTVGDALEIVRWCLYVCGVAGAAAGILGVFVLQGHRGARIALSAAAVAIVLTASVTGSFPGFLGMLIGIGTALLWTRPARDWFAGRPVTPRVVPEAPSAAPREQAPPIAWSPPQPGADQPADQPPPTSGWGQAPSSAPMPPPSAAELVWPPPGGPGPSAPPASGRPSSVRLACILTWVFSSLTAVGYLAVLVLLLADRDRFLEELQKSPGWQKSFDEDAVASVALVASSVFLVWSLAAIVLAALVWRRARWAWIALLVSTWTAGLVSVLAFPFSIPYLAAIGVSAAKLTVRPTRSWFSKTPHLPAPPGPQERPPVW